MDAEEYTCQHVSRLESSHDRGELTLMILLVPPASADEAFTDIYKTLSFEKVR